MPGDSTLSSWKPFCRNDGSERIHPDICPLNAIYEREEFTAHKIFLIVFVWLLHSHRNTLTVSNKYGIGCLRRFMRCSTDFFSSAPCHGMAAVKVGTGEVYHVALASKQRFLWPRKNSVFQTRKPSSSNKSLILHLPVEPA